MSAIVPEAEASHGKIYHGASAVKQLEAVEGELTEKEKRIVMLEGYSTGVYKDHKGIDTKGIGQTGKYMKMTAKESIAAHEDITRKFIKNYDSLPEYLQTELLQATYRGDLGGSPTARRLINEGKYLEAAEEFLDNREYKTTDKVQIKERMESVSEALKKYAGERRYASKR